MSAWQAYPAADSEEVVTMAANEIAAHTTLQPPAAPAECDQLAKLMGSFSPRAGPDAGEQVRCSLDQCLCLHPECCSAAGNTCGIRPAGKAHGQLQPAGRPGC